MSGAMSAPLPCGPGAAFVLATDDGFRLLDPGQAATRLIAPIGADDPERRMNDRKMRPERPVLGGHDAL